MKNGKSEQLKSNNKKYNIILAKAALELIPNSIERKAKKLKSYRFKILEVTYHYKWMDKLKDKEMRGRPDILHRCLLQILDSPINREGKLNIFVHTYNDIVIKVNPKTRLPKNYFRFLGIMQQLLKGKENPLFEVRKSSLEELLKSIYSKKVALFEKQGKIIHNNEQIKEYDTFIVGSFQKGHFELNFPVERISIYKEPLLASTVISYITTVLSFF